MLTTTTRRRCATSGSREYRRRSRCRRAAGRLGRLLSLRTGPRRPGGTSWAALQRLTREPGEAVFIAVVPDPPGAGSGLLSHAADAAVARGGGDGRVAAAPNVSRTGLLASSVGCSRWGWVGGRGALASVPPSRPSPAWRRSPTSGGGTTALTDTYPEAPGSCRIPTSASSSPAPGSATLADAGRALHTRLLGRLRQRPRAARRPGAPPDRST